jgi:hypothetical protein
MVFIFVLDLLMIFYFILFSIIRHLYHQNHLSHLSYFSHFFGVIVMTFFLEAVGFLFEIDLIFEVVLNFCCFYYFFDPNLCDNYFLFNIYFGTDNSKLLSIILCFDIQFFYLFFILLFLLLVNFSIMNMSFC